MFHVKNLDSTNSTFFRNPNLPFLFPSLLLTYNAGGFASYSSTIGSGVFKFGSSKGGSEFVTFTKIKTEYVSGE